MTTIPVPIRSHIFDLEDGTKQIHLTVNGRVAFAYRYDPRTNTLKEEEIGQARHQTLETKSDQPSTEIIHKH